uniref:Tf2-1-like SH3-like domain-containing protein n=1 Tax=Ananas comosus var. bracteatus TaxID=296719 RepID=A0A6V7NU20_ANACO|nr:unnamed protein product [Ananas comosus var. bracteatus]
MSYEEYPVCILDREVKKLRSRKIPYVKVQWSNHAAREATWSSRSQCGESIRNCLNRRVKSLVVDQSSTLENLELVLRHLERAFEAQFLGLGSSFGLDWKDSISLLELERDFLLPRVLRDSWTTPFGESKDSETTPYMCRHMAGLDTLPGRPLPVRGVTARVVRDQEIRDSGKLSLRFIGPYEILERVGPVAYRLALPPNLSSVHNVFHVSDLRKYVFDPTDVLDAAHVELRDDLSFEEQLVRILASEMRKLRNRDIPYVKVLWNNHGEREATWELESALQERYHHLFQMES